MSVTAGTPWSDADLAALAKHYPDTPNITLAQIFRRSERSVRNKAYSLGIYKAEAYLKEHGGHRTSDSGS